MKVLHRYITLLLLSFFVFQYTQAKEERIKQIPSQIVSRIKNITVPASPKALTFNKDNTEIWVTSLLNPKVGVSVVNASSGKQIANINLNNGGGVEVLFSKDKTKVYVSQMESGSIFEIDASTKKISRTLKTKSTWTKYLALSHDGNTLYASNWLGNNVSEIDLIKGVLKRNIKTVAVPRGIYPTVDGMYLYVAGFDTGELQKINLATGKGTIIYNGHGALRHIVADEEKNILYVSDMAKHTILKVSLANDLVSVFAQTDVNPNTIALSPDKKILIVSCRGTNFSATDYYQPGPDWGSVLLFDTENGNMLDAIVGGNQPTALDISSDGKTFSFSDFLDKKIEVFSLPSYAELKKGNGGLSSIYKKLLWKKK